MLLNILFEKKEFILISLILSLLKTKMKERTTNDLLTVKD